MAQAVYELAASRQRRVSILNPNDIHDCTKRNPNSNVNVQPQLRNINSAKKQNTLPDACKEVGLKAGAKNSECVLKSRQQNAEHFIT